MSSNVLYQRRPIKILTEGFQMPAFNLAVESSDIMNEFHKVVDPQTLAEASAAAVEEFREIDATGKVADELIDEQAKVMDIQDEVEHALEHGGLSVQAQRILKKSLIAIVGKNIANRRIPAMESDDPKDKITTTVLALEGIVQTVKDFWTGIKNQVTQFWNKTKTWYVKTFDVSNKIIARAKAIEQRVSSISASAKENSFEFSGVQLLAVNYQVKDPNVCIAGYEALNVVIGGAVENLSKENSSTKADSMLDNLKNMLTSTRNNATKQFKDNTTNGQSNDVGQLFSKALNDWYLANKQENPFKPDLTQAVQDPNLRSKMNGGDDRVNVLQGANLPGNRTLFRTLIDPQQNANIDPIELLKADRPIIGDTAAKPKEMENSADVKTLNAGQISKIASIAEDLGNTILKYKQEFEARDRFFNKMMKGFDQMVRDIEGSNVATESFEGFAMEAGSSTRRFNKNQKPPQVVQKPKPTTQPAPAAAPTTQPAAAPTNPAPAATPAANPAPAASTSTGGTTPVTPAANNAPPPQQNQPNNQQDQNDAEEKKAVEAVDKYFRRLVGALTGMFRRDVSYQGQLITMGIKSSSVYLTYAEQSLSQYGV